MVRKAMQALKGLTKLTPVTVFIDGNGNYWRLLPPFRERGVTESREDWEQSSLLELISPRGEKVPEIIPGVFYARYNGEGFLLKVSPLPFTEISLNDSDRVVECHVGDILHVGTWSISKLGPVSPDSFKYELEAAEAAGFQGTYDIVP